jgi:hypothetical protein
MYLPLPTVLFFSTIFSVLVNILSCGVTGPAFRVFDICILQLTYDSKAYMDALVKYSFGHKIKAGYFQQVNYVLVT